MADESPDMKRCCRCGVSKARELFYTDRRNKDGLQGACADCFNAGVRARIQKDHAAHLDKRREYYQKNKKTILASNSASRARHREAVLAGKRRYREENREKIAAATKDWIKRNPKKYSAYRRANAGRRRAAKDAGDSRTKIAAWVLEQPKVCEWCGKSCENDFHLDHVQPISKGGTHEIKNLAISCPSCNVRKSAKDLSRWLKECGAWSRGRKTTLDKGKGRYVLV